MLCGERKISHWSFVEFEPNETYIRFGIKECEIKENMYIFFL